MPSLTQSFPKKRRRDEDDVDGDICITCQQDFHDYYPHTHEHHSTSPRKTIPFSSSLAKKIRMTTAERTSNDEDQYAQQSPHKQALTPGLRHYHSRTPSATKQLPKTITTSANLLKPCHICHRKPTKKTELDSYADCEGCGMRTCYVCIRQCLDWKGISTSTTYKNDEALMEDREESESKDGEVWNQESSDRSFSMEDAPSATEDGHHGDEYDAHNRAKREGTWGKGGGTGHRRRICSQCCVEDGPEGEVICLGCLGTRG